MPWSQNEDVGGRGSCFLRRGCVAGGLRCCVYMYICVPSTCVSSRSRVGLRKCFPPTVCQNRGARDHVALRVRSLRAVASCERRRAVPKRRRAFARLVEEQCPFQVGVHESETTCHASPDVVCVRPRADHGCVGRAARMGCQLRGMHRRTAAEPESRTVLHVYVCVVS